MTPRRILPAMAALTLMLLAGCGASGHGAAPASPGGSAPIHHTAPIAFTISGQAATSAGTAVQGVLVGFRPTTAPASCATCDLTTATTDSAGRYTLQLAAGTYAAVCAATGQSCEFATSPPSAKLTVTISRSGSLNMLVSGTVPNPRASPTEPPAPSRSSAPSSPGGSGDVVSGHIVTSSGQPVPNADITFRQAGCGGCLYQPHTETGADGSYSITLQPGVYNAECDVIGTCGAEGADDIGGVPVNVPPGGTLNFIVCPSDAGIPQCLK
jgi:hypothetical protein